MFGESTLNSANWSNTVLKNEWTLSRYRKLICVSYWISAKRKVELLAAQSCRGRPPHSGRIGRLIDEGCARCALKAISHYSVASLVHCINCISSGSCCCDKDCSLTAKNWPPRRWCPAAARLFDEPTSYIFLRWLYRRMKSCGQDVYRWKTSVFSWFPWIII